MFWTDLLGNMHGHFTSRASGNVKIHCDFHRFAGGWSGGVRLRYGARLHATLP